MNAIAKDNYSVDLAIDYPEQERNRLTVFFRIFMIIPIGVVLSLLLNCSAGTEEGGLALGGLVVLPVLLMILFRQKYPRWWFDWNAGLMAFGLRVAGYLFLLTDVYPSTDEEQSVHLHLTYPDAARLNRWLPLVKWLLAIPHYLALLVLSLAGLVGVLVSWFILIFTGRTSRPLFDFIAGVLRWHVRVAAYAFLMVTDEYPPFTLL
jgi:hypothetical protein